MNTYEWRGRPTYPRQFGNTKSAETGPEWACYPTLTVDWEDGEAGPMSKLMLRYIRPCPSYISDSMPVSASEVAKALDKNEYITWIPPV